MLLRVLIPKCGLLQSQRTDQMVNLYQSSSYKPTTSSSAVEAAGTSQTKEMLKLENKHL